LLHFAGAVEHHVAIARDRGLALLKRGRGDVHRAANHHWLRLDAEVVPEIDDEDWLAGAEFRFELLRTDPRDTQLAKEELAACPLDG
jgi:hypothetical protein